jgi:hypothetical protein
MGQMPVQMLPNHKGMAAVLLGVNLRAAKDLSQKSCDMAWMIGSHVQEDWRCNVSLLTSS